MNKFLRSTCLVALILFLVGVNLASAKVNIKSACECLKQGYSSGKYGMKNLNGCYKGKSGHHDVRKAFNEGYWYGSKESMGQNIGSQYNSARRKFCGF